VPFFPAVGASHVREAGMLIRKLKVNPWRKPIWAWLTPAEKKRAETSLRFDLRNENRYACIDGDLGRVPLG